MVIQYYADSLGMPRIGLVTMKQRYIRLLEGELKQALDEEIYVLDRAKGGCTLYELYGMFRQDEGYLEQPNVLIINGGIVDCAPRPIPLSLRNFISRLPASIRTRIVSFLHHNRARILKAGFSYYLTSQRKYEKTVKEWLAYAATKFDRIYFINIAPTNESTEKHSPGFTESINTYNSISKRVIKTIGSSKITLIDTHQLFFRSGYPLDQLIVKEDGHHLTALAHKVYASELITLELCQRKVNA